MSIHVPAELPVTQGSKNGGNIADIPPALLPPYFGSESLEFWLGMIAYSTVMVPTMPRDSWGMQIS